MTVRSEQTQIKLFLKEQSNQGLHCLRCNSFTSASLDALLYDKTSLFKF